MQRNRRIGCSISGVAQFIAKHGVEALRVWLMAAYAELERLDKFVPSGSMECVSDYGVHDLTGNADEWVAGPSSHPSNLMGGHPFKVRNRCNNAVTDGHGETFAYYVTSFRCCKDLK